MFQLKFNDDFTQVIMDIPCWKNKEDIPDDIKKFIINTSNKMVFYEENTGNFYCGKCVEPLDETFYCSGCGVQHKKHTTNIDDLYISNDITILDKKIYNMYVCRCKHKKRKTRITITDQDYFVKNAIKFLELGVEVNE